MTTVLACDEGGGCQGLRLAMHSKRVTSEDWDSFAPWRLRFRIIQTAWTAGRKCVAKWPRIS